MLTIKQYAINKGVSTQAVYKQIKTHEKALEGHIQKINGSRYLDDEAVAYLNSQSENAPSVVIQENNSERVAELEADKQLLLLKINQLQEQLIAKCEKIEKLQQSNIELLETDQRIKKRWFRKK